MISGEASPARCVNGATRAVPLASAGAIADAPAGVPQVLGGLLARARAAYVQFAIDVLDDGDLERLAGAVTGLPPWRPPRRR